ncbi:MAG: YlxR family protein [Desulfotomaculum sp.]|nr:YlxR family protein [Desulfotomaculum sp.]
MPKCKKQPVRMCAGCRQLKFKKELLRVVRTPEKGIEIDYTGKKTGRGVYICQQLVCLEKANKGKRLEKALRSSVNKEIYEALRQALVAGISREE